MPVPKARLLQRCVRPPQAYAYTFSKPGNLMGLLHGVYPEQNNEILPLHFVQGQNDKK